MRMGNQVVRALFLHCCLLPLTTVYGQSLPIITIPAAPGTYTLTAGQSVTAANLPGATLDSNPPQLGTVPTYPSFHQDGVSPPPYVSPNLQNFGLTHFNNTLTFGGAYTWSINDYASVHGFNAITAYNRAASTAPWIPTGTGWSVSTDQPGGADLMAAIGLAADRYDQVLAVGEPAIIQALSNGHYLSWINPATITELSVDMEHKPLSPTDLRQQSWYPTGGNVRQKLAFEKQYYDGYAMTLYATVDYFRQLGYRNISLYGWQPADTGYNELFTFNPDPNTDWYWQNVGIQVMSHVDSVNFRSYSDYWSPLTTAYTLAQSDIALAYVRSLPANQRKPVRANFGSHIIGGGGPGEWRWWAGQPAAPEETRAIVLLNAFTQYDGMVDFDFSGNTNFNLPTPVATGADVMLKDGTFTAPQEGGGTRTFARYDVLHITSVDNSGNVRFQLIDKPNFGNNYGIQPTLPFYDSTSTLISSHLRSHMEPFAGMFEGLALVKTVESFLRSGNALIDFDSVQTFKQGLPILRRVVNGNQHLIATYDPQVIYGQPARSITVNNFNGISGLSITFPADEQVRLFMIELPST